MRNLLIAAAVFAGRTGASHPVATPLPQAAAVSRTGSSSAAIGLIDGYGAAPLTTNAFDVTSTAEIGRPATAG